MKILTLCYEYPPLGGGGGRAAKSVADALAQRGHEVRFQTAGMPHLAKHEVINGVEVFRSNSFRKSEERCTVPEMGFFLATSFLPTLRQIRAWKPDVIHAHFAVPTGALAYAAHKHTGVPYALTVQLGDVPGGVPEQTDRLFRWLNPCIKPIWKNAAGITVVSEFIKELAVKAYGFPVVKIPNGIALDDASEKPLTVSEPVELVSVGRFNPQKNLPFLIDSIAKIADLNWRLTMIGDGSETPAVRERIAHHGLENRVTLRGWLSADEVQTTLANSDLLLMPSLSEGLPVASVEALKQGLAILGSDIGGLLDVIDDGVNGFLVSLDQPQLYAEKLRELLANRDLLLQMKNASRKKASNFDILKIAEQYETVLENCVKLR